MRVVERFPAQGGIFLEGDFMNARIYGSLRTASILAVAGALAAASQAFAAGWTNTATQALPLVEATDLGSLSANAPLRIAVALKLPDASALRRLVEEQNTPGSAQYGRFLTPSQFNAQY